MPRSTNAITKPARFFLGLTLVASLTVYAGSALLAQQNITITPTQTPVVVSPAAPASADPLPEAGLLTPSATGLTPNNPPPPSAPPANPELDSKLDEAYRSALNYEPGFTGRTGVTLLDAVRATLLQSPQIQLGVQDSVIAKGAVKIITGEFDATIFGEYSIGREWKPKSPAEVRQQVLKRQLLYQAFRSMLAQTRGLQGEDALNKGTPRHDTPAEKLNNIMQDIVSSKGTKDQQEEIGEILYQLNKSMIKSGQKEESGILKGIRDEPINSVIRTETLTYDAGVRKLFRNGVSAEVSGMYNHAVDKKLPDDVNTSKIGLTINVPLGRGAGVQATGAPERAALIDYGASLLNLRQTTAVSVYETILAYWECVAAEERLALLQRSEELNYSLLDFSRVLLDRGRITRDEIPLAEARYNTAKGIRIMAELGVVAANQKLALAMGVPAERISVFPVAADPFPASVTGPMVAGLSSQHLIGASLQRRGDYLALLQMEKSGKVLAEAARLDLRPRIDLMFKLGYNGVDEGSDFENNYNAFFQDPRGPNFSVGGRIEWPVANNTQEGFYVQAYARFQQAQIRSADLSRQIVSNVVYTQQALLNIIRQLENFELAAQRYMGALTDARSRFSRADSRGSLNEVIDTEERLTRARTDLVNARLMYAQTLARLRFETATLVPEGVIIQNKTPVAQVEAINARDLITLPKPPSFPLTEKAAALRSGAHGPLSTGDGAGPKVKIYTHEPDIPLISGHPAWHR